MTTELDERKLNCFQFFAFLEACWRLADLVDPFAPGDALKLFLDGLKAARSKRSRDASPGKQSNSESDSEPPS